MAEGNRSRDKEAKEPFYKNRTNLVLAAVAVVLAGYTAYNWLHRDKEGRRKIDDVVRPGGALGRDLPSEQQIEGFYKDQAGSVPIAQDFDADKGEICGNGKSYFWTSKPPKKPDPPGWKAPPRPGTDPSYEGPDPLAPFRESPYAMPSSKDVLARPPIRDLGDPTLLEEVKRAVALAPGKVGLLGAKETPSILGPIAQRVVPLDPALFEGDDDAPVAAGLKAKGVDYVLVDRTAPLVSAWIEERMSSVRIRLRDAVSLSYFHPAVVGSAWALYRVAPPFEIAKSDKRRLTARARDLLLGRQPPPFDLPVSLAAVGDEEHRVIVSLRWRAEPKVKGRKVARKLGHGKTVVAALDAAIAKIREDWADIRSSAAKGYEADVSVDLPAAVSKMEIDIDVLFDVCALTDKQPANLVWYLEQGIEGLSLRGKGDFLYLEPSYALHMETGSEVTFLERMLDKAGLDEKFLRAPRKKSKKDKVLDEAAWREDKTYRFGRFRTLDWIEREAGGDIAELYRGVPLKTIWDVSRAGLVRSLNLGAGWLMRNQTPDGQYAYKYDPLNKPGRRWSAGGNIVRHALNPYTLLMVNKIDPNPSLVESAKRGIGFTLKFLRHAGLRCTICHRDPPARYYNAKIGTVAVTILSILKLGDVADISEYDEVLRCLGEELLYVQDKNGHFWQYDVPPDHPYYGAESTIAPGEIVFALSRLYSHYKDKKYKDAVDRALPFYMRAWRKLLGERTPEGIFDEEHRVNLIGIVPWLVTAMNDLHKTTGDRRYADLAFEQQDWIDREFYWYPSRSQYPDYVGASFKTHRELPAINSCQYIEGAAAAYAIAKRTHKNEELRRQVVVHGVRFCLQLQYDGYDSTFFLPVPEEAMGGYRYTLGHTRLRNDYSYHAMAALAQAVDYLEPDDYPAERPLRIPLTLRELLGGLPSPAADAPRKDGQVAAPILPAYSYETAMKGGGGAVPSAPAVPPSGDEVEEQ
ncbi:MAG: hypothetical protein PHU25_06280 [Deltaproteobacteria bacterium]|nr:hypothetical protein [Deltaproteobacteria bacterium]